LSFNFVGFPLGMDGLAWLGCIAICVAAFSDLAFVGCRGRRWIPLSYSSRLLSLFLSFLVRPRKCANGKLRPWPLRWWKRRIEEGQKVQGSISGRGVFLFLLLTC
jgi:hypothetical protein